MQKPQRETAYHVWSPDLDDSDFWTTRKYAAEDHYEKMVGSHPQLNWRYAWEVYNYHTDSFEDEQYLQSYTPLVKDREAVCADRKTIAVYTTLKMLEKIRDQLGPAAVEEFIATYFATVESYNPWLKTLVSEALAGQRAGEFLQKINLIRKGGHL